MSWKNRGGRLAKRFKSRPVSIPMPSSTVLGSRRESHTLQHHAPPTTRRQQTTPMS